MAVVLELLIKVSDFVWEIPASFKDEMNAPARIYASEKLMKEGDELVFEQITNVATPPGILRYAYCMPDAHSSYGFLIGGVAAMDAQTGVYPPGESDSTSR